MAEGRVHFISGLPRSGSTLLVALLRQNPRFSAAVTSPVLSLVNAVIPRMGAGEFAPFFNDQRRAAILRALFFGYHGPLQDRTLFDTNRLWTGKLPLIETLFPGARVICCVRQVGWILDSLERQLRDAPLTQSRLVGKAGGSVYQRAAALMDAETGLVGQAWSALREAWFSEQAGALIVVNYDTLASAPAATMAKLYGALGEAPFAHDFEAVVHDEPDYDEALGLPGLHRVRPRVEHRPRRPCIPPDLFDKHEGAGFWARPEMNRRGVLVL